MSVSIKKLVPYNTEQYPARNPCTGCGKRIETMKDIQWSVGVLWGKNRHHVGQVSFCTNCLLELSRLIDSREEDTQRIKEEEAECALLEYGEEVFDFVELE